MVQNSSRTIRRVATRSVAKRTTLGTRYLDLLPGLIGIEPRHPLGNGFGALAEILLVDLAGMIDHEGHHTGVAVFGRIGNQRKASDHLAVDDIVHLASGRVRTL